jgi:hypothetical protein
VSGQGTFIYDQQSSDESHFGEGGIPVGVQALGQSFTPSLSAVGFIRIHVGDANPGNVRPGTLNMNLRADSITGTILGSATPVTLPAGYIGTVNFLFPAPISVTPGTPYYFEPIFVSGGGAWMSKVTAEYRYAGGMAFWDGEAQPGQDFWFREGIIPEPSTAGLLVVGVGVLIWRRWPRRQLP